MMGEDSFWGKIDLDAKLETPAGVLKRQAAALSKETRGLLDAHIRTLPRIPSLGSIVHELQVIAPALGNYTRAVLTIGSEVDLYPVNVLSDLEGWTASAENLEEFEAILRKALGSEKVMKMITALVAQSAEAGGQ